jgi:hypothetical protein
MPRCHEQESDASDDEQECAESGEEGGGADNASNADNSHVGQMPEVAQIPQAIHCEEDSGGGASFDHYVVRPGCVRRLVMHMVDPAATDDDAKRFRVIECVSLDAEHAPDECKHTRFAELQEAIDHLRGDSKKKVGRIAVRSKDPNVAGNTLPAPSSKTQKRKYDQLSRHGTETDMRAKNSR